jgi:hypothetical protein
MWMVWLDSDFRLLCDFTMYYDWLYYKFPIDIFCNIMTPLSTFVILVKIRTLRTNLLLQGSVQGHRWGIRWTMYFRQGPHADTVESDQPSVCGLNLVHTNTRVSRYPPYSCTGGGGGRGLERGIWKRTTVQFSKLYGVFNRVRNGSERLRKAVFCEKRLSNAQGRGLCETNAGYAPRGMVCWWRDGRGIPSIDKIGGVTQALLVEEGASKL